MQFALEKLINIPRLGHFENAIKAADGEVIPRDD